MKAGLAAAASAIAALASSLAAALLLACLAWPAPAAEAAGGHPAVLPAAEGGRGHGSAGGPGDPAPEAFSGHEPAVGDSAGNAAGARWMSAGELAASFGPEEGLLVAFYVFFLLLSGVVLWWILSRGWTEAQKRLIGRHLLQLARLSFLAVLANLLLVFGRLGGFDDPSVLFSLADERDGLIWLALLALSAAGLFLLQKSKLFDTLWLLAAVAAVTGIGHAELSLNAVLSSLFAAVHLLAAALWIGGLYVVLALRRRHRRDAERLVPNAMNAAVAAMVLLFVSGLVNSAMYLPDLSLIGRTRWGLILAGKTILFALFVLLAAVARRLRNGPGPGFLRLQLALVLVLAAVSGVMPISPPVPDEGPLHWHEMGEDLHMTAEIVPLRVGANVCRVTVWLPEGSGGPRSAEVELRPEGGGGGARTVELERKEREADVAFAGFDDYHFETSGAHIDHAGRWTVTVRIADADGHVRTFTRAVAVY